MRNMDYFAQNQDLDLRSFFESKGLRLSDDPAEGPSDNPVDTPINKPIPPRWAPPPKDSVWVSAPDQDA